MTKKPAAVEAPLPPVPPVAVKGRGEGLRIVVSRPEAADIEASLRDQLARRAGAFFTGASVVIELPEAPLDLELAARLAEVVHDAGMRLTAVSTVAPKGVESRSHAAPATPAAPSDGALVVTATVRGGQRIVHDGTILVLGDVNPGASVVAGGSVVVWGHLRGTVEAGLDEEAGSCVVCALDLAPTQLRIGAAIARTPEEPGRTPVPEVARQENGRIVVDAWL